MTNIITADYGKITHNRWRFAGRSRIPADHQRVQYAGLAEGEIMARGDAVVWKFVLAVSTFNSYRSMQIG
ncbi:MAG: hypothetical protein H7251_13205 [Acetobacteraceae bacterium]|nr:hypothetical protein [Acetobacteraceae bacterium]